MKTPFKFRFLLFALTCSVSLTSCDTPPTLIDTCTDHELICKGREHLAAGEAVEAINTFEELEALGEHPCDAAYGQLLGSLLDGFDKLDALLDSVALFLDAGLAPGISTANIRQQAARLEPTQFGDLNSLVEGFLKPFEETADNVRTHARETLAIDSCVFDLYEGFPINVGTENSLLFFSSTLGYQWDSSAARLLLAGVNAFQVIVNFVLAHSLSFDDLTGPLGLILDEIDALFTQTNSNSAQTTYITVLRVAGAIADYNPGLLTFATSGNTRMEEIDNLLLEQYRALYDDTGAGIKGFIPDMVANSKQDPNPTDNVFGWIDNGTAGAGSDDKMIIGVRSLNLFSSIALTDNTGGIEVTFNRQWGDMDKVLEMVHQIIDVLGNQVEAVEDKSISYPSGDYRPLGFEELNVIINSVGLLNLFLPKIPEAIEFDFRSYFVGPNGQGPLAFRELFPYWYDHDNCALPDPGDYSNACKSDHFMIEGEAAVSAPSVLTLDTRHFALLETTTADPFTDTIQFGSYKDFEKGDEVAVSGVSIPSDGVSAAELGFEIPFPYIGWQNPSFHGIVLVDETKLPVGAISLAEAEAQGQTKDYKGEFFEPADQFRSNKALNAYITYFLDQGNPFSDLANDL